MENVIDWSSQPFSSYPVVYKLSLRRTGKMFRGHAIYTDGDRFYHKDKRHAEVEVYNRRREHIGVLTPEGEKHPKKGKVSGRRLPG